MMWPITYRPVTLSSPICYACRLRRRTTSSKLSSLGMQAADSDWNKFGHELQTCPSSAHSGSDIDACLLNSTWCAPCFWRRRLLERQLFNLLQAGSKYCIREWILFSGWIWFWEHLCLVAAYLPFISDPVGPFGKILSVDRRPAGSTRCRNGALRIHDRSAHFQCIRWHLGMRNCRLLSLLRDARYRSAGNWNGHVLHCTGHVATAARKQAESQQRLVSGRCGSWRDTANSCFGGTGGGRRASLVCGVGRSRELLGETAEEFCSFWLRLLR